MRGTLRAVGAKALMPSNALATLMALTPPGPGVEYLHSDEDVRPVDPATACDLVALTGYTVHAERLTELARVFRARGVPVALGGPFATLHAERARPLADHLFVGEGEHTWPRFLLDFCAGRPEARYEQPTYVDLASSPPPDWSLVDGRDYLYLTVQTSRGCPNRCDFCDAIQLVGRKVRQKSVEQALVEVDNARRAGAETVFFSEDNFGVDRRLTHEFLGRLIAWNTALEHPIQFSCQTSVRITDDDETLRLLADARFAALFIGVESVREDCLREVNKGQLFRADLAERVRRLSEHGLLALLGMIVGFDADDEDTFPELEAFLRDTYSPLVSISVLNAPEGTPLHARLQTAGRIDEQFDGKWHNSTNIVPRQWPLEELRRRHRELFQRLFEPAQFEARARAWLSNVRHVPTLYRHKRRPWRNWLKVGHILRHYLTRMPPEARRSAFHILQHAWRTDPRLIRKAITILTQYCHYHDFASKLEHTTCG
jgi:radical SAM superfamily enzyme YgiQ (UPF0313 family)